MGLIFIILYFIRYDGEATFFDEGVRSSKRQQLEEKLLQVINTIQDLLSMLLKLYADVSIKINDS